MDELTFHAGQRIEIKPGYKAIVQFVKLEANPSEVLKMLVDFDIDTGRKGDLRDIQRLAKVALGMFDEPESSGRTDTDTDTAEGTVRETP